MGIRKRLQYWFIYHWLLKADMNGYSGLTVYYAFSLPLLSPEVKDLLKANKIKTSEGVRDGKVWRCFFWEGEGRTDYIIPRFRLW